MSKFRKRRKSFLVAVIIIGCSTILIGAFQNCAKTNFSATSSKQQSDLSQNSIPSTRNPFINPNESAPISQPLIDSSNPDSLTNPSPVKQPVDSTQALGTQNPTSIGDLTNPPQQVVMKDPAACEAMTNSYFPAEFDTPRIILSATLDGPAQTIFRPGQTVYAKVYGFDGIQYGTHYTYFCETEIQCQIVSGASIFDFISSDKKNMVYSPTEKVWRFTLNYNTETKRIITIMQRRYSKYGFQPHMVFTPIEISN